MNATRRLERARGHVERDCIVFGDGIAQGDPQFAIFVHDAERGIVMIRHEIELTGFQSVADPDLPDRATLARQTLRDADRFEHLVTGAGDRRGAPVEIGRDDPGRISRIDDAASEAVRGESDRERLSDQSAARNDYVAAVRVCHIELSNAWSRLIPA